MYCAECSNKRNTLAGQAMTNWACSKCNRQATHSTTDTPTVCWTCSEKYKVCTKCGVEI